MERKYQELLSDAEPVAAVNKVGLTYISIPFSILFFMHFSNISNNINT
jgi:hypothetical protein